MKTPRLAFLVLLAPFALASCAPSPPKSAGPSEAAWRGPEVQADVLVVGGTP